jgi:Family of unknown function (DUF5335)
MAEDTREIPREDWTDYFDELGRLDPPPTVTVEVDGEEVGAQTEAGPSLLAAVSYDHRDDVLVVGFGSTDKRAEHLVYAPRRVYALESDGGVEAIDVEDAEGTKTVIRLRVA